MPVLRQVVFLCQPSQELILNSQDVWFTKAEGACYIGPNVSTVV